MQVWIPLALLYITCSGKKTEASYLVLPYLLPTPAVSRSKKKTRVSAAVTDIGFFASFEVTSKVQEFVHNI